MEWRDALPKLGLAGRYIGDGLPLCSDLPERHFLRIGATYQLRGVHKHAILHKEDRDEEVYDEYEPLSLEPESNLYKTLCGGGPTCNYQSKVVLESDIQCHGVECDIDSARVVEVEKGVFYEYIRVPCANQAFFDGGQMLKAEGWKFSCGDPRTEVGGIACCEAGASFSAPFDYKDPSFFRFSGERVRFQKASQTCNDLGLVVCSHTNFACEGDCDRYYHDYWNSLSCKVQVKVDLDGSIAVVHDIPDHPWDIQSGIWATVNSNTKTFFRAQWDNSITDNILQNYTQACDDLGCGRDPEDNLCLCNTEVSHERAFSAHPSRAQVLNDLFIGAFSPALYPQPGLREVETSYGVTVYSFDGNDYSTETIFSVVDDFGVTQFRKNVKSSVQIGRVGGLTLSFRNPNHIVSLTDPTVRDAQYETEAALDHYFVSEKKLVNTSPICSMSLLTMSFLASDNSTTKMSDHFLLYVSPKGLEFQILPLAISMLSPLRSKVVTTKTQLALNRSELASMETWVQ